jgi:hypothetical protein
MVINKKVEKGSKVITFKMVEEINQDNPVKVLNKEEIVLFLQVVDFHIVLISCFSRIPSRFIDCKDLRRFPVQNILSVG